MATPELLAQKKRHYRIVHRLERTDASTLTLTLNPMSFPVDGLCRVEARTIASVGTGAGIVAINMDVSQPYSQSNNSSGDVRWNTTRLLAYHGIVNGNSVATATTPSFAEVVLKPNMRITFSVSTATTDGFTANTDWTTILLDLMIKVYT